MLRLFFCTFLLNNLRISKNIRTFAPDFEKEIIMAITVSKRRRVSKTMKFATENKGLIYEVTDPELRSQLSFYRNKERQNAL